MIREPPRFTPTDTLLAGTTRCRSARHGRAGDPDSAHQRRPGGARGREGRALPAAGRARDGGSVARLGLRQDRAPGAHGALESRDRWEEHTSEHQSQMRNAYAASCVKKKKEQANRQKETKTRA